jgi:hypothetical protein
MAKRGRPKKQKKENRDELTESGEDINLATD